MAINVLYNTTDTSQKQYQKSITNVSPNATDESITTFVQGVNALTNNTITAIRKVETTDLLNPEEDTRLDRNLQITDENDKPITSIPLASLGEGLDNAFGVIIQDAGINYETEFWVKFTFPENGSTSTSAPCVNIDVMNGEADFYVFKNGTDPLNASAMTVNFPATDTYKAATVTVPITE